MMKPGRYNMTFDEYKAVDALNNSFLGRFAKRADLAMLPKEDTAAMAFGRAYHAYVLDPVDLLGNYAFMPEKMIRNGKKWDQFQLDNPGREYISYNDFEVMKPMKESLHSGRHETARNIIEKSKKEVSIFWKKDKIDRKARLDCMWQELHLIADLKTCTNADWWGWIKIGVNAGLFPFRQPAWYLEGANKTADKGDYYDKFMWILSETKPPYGVSVTQCPEEPLHIAEMKTLDLLIKYKKCKKDNEWIGFADEVKIDLEFDKWILDKI